MVELSIPAPTVQDVESSADAGPGWARGTAARIFVIMLIALLPLAALAIISSWQSLRTAEREQRTMLEASVRQNAGQLAGDVRAIQTAQTLTATVLAGGTDAGDICGRLQTLLRTIGGNRDISSMVMNAQGEEFCRSANWEPIPDAVIAGLKRDHEVVLAPDRDGLLVASRSRDGQVIALALYRRAALRQLVTANIVEPDSFVELEQGDKKLALALPRRNTDATAPRMSAQAPVGDHGFYLTIGIDAHRPTITRTIALLMPLLLLLTAAVLSWLVVRWLLIRPLIALQREVAAYEPGEIINPPQTPHLTSREIVDLGGAFHAMSEDVAEHESEMRDALLRQTRLTREVHHRVKNNLQIISSLISLHWRAAPQGDIGAAYLSIQRRVDSLAVVQRNHYAELDEERGVRARPMITEIASGLKTSAQVQSGRNLEIAIYCDDVYLHQDVAAPVAFMTAELADLVIALGNADQLRISLVREPGDGTARFALAAPAFRDIREREGSKVELCERVLVGLARQLRTPLGHDAELGEYSVTISVTA